MKKFLGIPKEYCEETVDIKKKSMNSPNVTNCTVLRMATILVAALLPGEAAIFRFSSEVSIFLFSTGISPGRITFGFSVAIDLLP
jgi:hypothetical protein